MNKNTSRSKNSLIFAVFAVFIVIFSISGLLMSSTAPKMAFENQLISLNQGFGDFWFKQSYDAQWIENSGFSSGSGWVPLVDGDSADFEYNISGGQANLIINGTEETFIAHSGTPTNDTGPYWYNSTNPRLDAYPTLGFGLNESGFYASHKWDEHNGSVLNANQKASVQWAKTIVMPKDMSDYNITGASLDIMINATAKAYEGRGYDQYGGWGGVEAFGEGTGEEYDYVRFYAIVSNFERTLNFTIADYQNKSLGKDPLNLQNETFDYIYDTVFSNINMEDFIFYLNQVLKDNYKNFTLILGMEFNCEDNFVTDIDEFTNCVIKSCDFNITYQRVINQDTSVSWEYQGKQIDSRGGTVEIYSGKLFFDCKINDRLIGNITPNSEIIVSINNKEYRERVKISNLEENFGIIVQDGFDLTNLIPDDEEIHIKITLYIADEFDLNTTYFISLDNAILNLSYDIYLPQERVILYQILFVSALLLTGGLIGFYIYYRKVLRFPKQVRKIRKFRKSLRKTSKPNIRTSNRQEGFYSRYQNEIGGGTFKNRLVNNLVKKPIKALKNTANSLNENKTPLSLIIFLIFLILGFVIFPIFTNLNFRPNSNSHTDYVKLSQTQNNQWLRQSYQAEWIENSNFTDATNWFNLTTGDQSDLNGSIEEGVAKYNIIGDNGSKTWNETPDVGGWEVIDNPDNVSQPIESNYSMDEYGWFMTHFWNNQEGQTRRIQWQKNFTIEEDMSEYSITDASLEMWVNATVQAENLDNGGIDVPGDTKSGPNEIYYAMGDFIDYYLLISSLDNSREFETLYFRPEDLGKDGDGTQPITTLNDTIITTSDKETLIYYLEEALKKDNHNFSLTIGIFVWCEDNGYPTDRDYWEEIWIKNLSLSISYEKIIDPFSSFSWIYSGEKLYLEGDLVEITGATLNFDYKADQTIPFGLTQNSEFRFLINDLEHTETIKLYDTPTEFQSASEAGFEIDGDLIPYNESISLAIQLYIADPFILNETRTLSIDNVSLIIYYDVLTPTTDLSNIYLALSIGLAAGAVAIGAYIVYYYRVLRFPTQVRKVRKFKKSLNKNEAPKGIFIAERERAFTRKLNNLIGKYSEQSSKTGFISKLKKGTPSTDLK